MSRLPITSSSSAPQSSPATDSTGLEFDFDRWAVAVKRQMIESLKRKGMS